MCPPTLCNLQVHHNTAPPKKQCRLHFLCVGLCVRAVLPHKNWLALQQLSGQRDRVNFMISFPCFPRCSCSPSLNPFPFSSFPVLSHSFLPLCFQIHIPVLPGRSFLFPSHPHPPFLLLLVPLFQKKNKIKKGGEQMPFYWLSNHPPSSRLLALIDFDPFNPP